MTEWTGRGITEGQSSTNISASFSALEPFPSLTKQTERPEYLSACASCRMYQRLEWR
jgi:hypothetical protein